jgi:CheY-like chemotaxis protein
MYRILYVEDEIFNTRLIKKMLKPMGYQILDAETALEGLEVADEQQPDVILMDVNLPDMNGYEVTRRLKQSSLSHIPVIILTADMSAHTRKACFEAGCDVYLNKPVSAATLHRAIQQVTHQATVA